MASMDNDEGIQGYLYEPQRSDFQHLCQDSTDSSDLSESEPENVAVNWRQGRAKMASAVWCKCGRCIVQKSDAECFCCKEHELLADRSKTLICTTDIDNLEAYIAHKPSTCILNFKIIITRFYMCTERH
ncbi:hypothetical protein LSH36_290g04031 [Paralvinella palmiformis]|uniref:Uncharacterized protein n=1 Tax=Paralvinella palmiformis TaxID=53620 RepID=A0AAD9N469_9ANNE|nr:hypothetical protein LSH36_290g04031 [Paralvinella palmiformis]